MSQRKWYYSQNLKPQGPVSEEEIRLKIHRGEIGLYDLLSLVEEGTWKPASEWRYFEASLFPSQQKVANPEMGEDLDASWVLLLNSKQEGPFSSQQILQMVRSQQITASQLIWKSGLSGWCQIGDRPEFRSLINSEHL
ncbi:GYF domain-containing protein [Bdellovibrio sp. HCB2-146]|uniref:GYF domain-containing protein n=1 Tax=Bdellovibrio sp. HCB2-146 TaxID=3394362 RepID=UPI0039BCD1F8